MLENSCRSHLRPLALTCLLACAAPQLHAESYAMIMTIGNYSNPNASLPGIDLDAALARKIAASMGVSDANVMQYKDSQLALAGVRTAFEDLTARISSGDNVFLYYSGHGTQRRASGGAQCSEGMVAHDMSSFDDSEFEEALARLTQKAGQVVMLNDSCFSGGQATKSISTDKGRVAKTWKGSASDSNYQCGHAVNAKMTRNLVPTAAKQGSNLLYIAAANDNEVAFASPAGSSATVAWANCLHATADTDRSGMLTGRELLQCAQNAVRQQNYNQTITLVGNADLPLSFVNAGGAGAAVGQPNALATLANLQQQASPAIQVTLSSAKKDMKIGKDYLSLSVTTNRDGYLYLLNVGSDGTSFDLLFPNDRDSNNFVKAGTVSLPRPSWGIQAMGPVGSSRLLAILSETPRQFDKGMAPIPSTPFKSSGATYAASRNLGVVAAGQGSAAPGRMGASQIITINEVK